MVKSRLPEKWDWLKLKDLVSINYGKGLGERQRLGGNIAVYGSNGVVGQHNTALTLGQTIIVGRKGSAGAINYSEQACWPIDTTYFIDQFPDFLNPRYLYHFLRSQPLSSLQQSAAIPGLNRDVLYSVEIPIPFPKDPVRSLETQRRIVLRLETLLEEVKSARELQGKIEEETNLLVDAVLNEIFSSRDQWQNEKRLDELVSIEASLVDPREPEYSSLPHIYGASIESGTGRLLEYHSAAEDGMTSSKYLFEPGVVLYSKIRPYLRKVTIVDFKGVCSADMYPLTVTSEEILPEFLMWSLLSPEFTEFINAFSLRARIPKVNREQLMAYRMRYPNINSQKKIAAYIQNWREEVSEMQRAQNENAELLEQTEQSFLAQAFRGEL